MTKFYSVLLLFAASLFFVGCDKDDDEQPTEQPVPAAKVKAATVQNLSPEFITIDGLAAGQEAAAGDTISFRILPGEYLFGGFQDYHLEHIHIHVADTVFTPAVYTSPDSIVVRYAVPAEDYDVVVCYAIQQQFSAEGHTMSLEPNDAVSLYGVDPNKKYKYFDAYLLTSDAYTITSVGFKVGDADWQDASSTVGCSFSRSETVPNVYHITIRPDYEDVQGDVVLRVQGEQHARYAVKWNGATAEVLDLELSTLPSEQIDGEMVTAELYVNSDYYLNGATSSVSGHEVNVYSRAYVQFVMPKSDVEINLDILHKIPVSCTAGANMAEAKVYTAPDVYYGVETALGIPGEPVYVFAEAAEGYKPQSATVSGGGKAAFEHYAYDMYYAEVLLPEGATSAAISVDAVKAYRIGGTDNIQFDNGTLFAEGEEVRMSIGVPEGKQISSVKATDANGGNVPVSLDLPYATLRMPASDVTVSVDYKDVDTSSKASVKAYFDADQYRVRSSTNYDWDFAQGFYVDKGTTFYVSVYDDYGMDFYVGVKIGDTYTCYPATEDEDSGEYSFGKALVANGDVIIKVGPTQSSVTIE